MFDINTAANVAAGRKPWESLGSDIRQDFTTQEILDIAKLNWHVSKRLVRMRINPQEAKEKVIPGYHAIVRDTDSKVFNVASERYHPIQNDKIIEFFQQYTKAGGMQFETVGGLNDGAVVWGLASIGKDFSLKGGDKVGGYLLLANSHDGSLSFNAAFTSVRVVCYNTLMSALSQKGNGKWMFCMRHSKEFTDEVVKDAKNKLWLAIQEMEALQEAATFLSEKHVDSRGQVVMEYLIRLTNPGLLADVVATTARDSAVGPNLSASGSLLDSLMEQHEADTKVKEKLTRGKISEENLGRVGRYILGSIIDSPGSELPSAKDTWWGVLNGVTHYADHLAREGIRIRGYSLRGLGKRQP